MTTMPLSDGPVNGAGGVIAAGADPATDPCETPDPVRDELDRARHELATARSQLEAERFVTRRQREEGERLADELDGARHELDAR
ncbi:MAG: hypothetical protein M3Q48_09250, partial [Actinomycetota bacterium]|nr:hypothetical protein [Actinomycetota bacterium]